MPAVRVFRHGMLRLSLQCAVHRRTVCLVGSLGTCGVDATILTCFNACAENQGDEAAELVKELVHLHEARAVPLGGMAILYRQIRQVAAVLSWLADQHCSVIQPSVTKACTLSHTEQRCCSWSRLPASA